jgi:CheY-like chemotaxis protein
MSQARPWFLPFRLWSLASKRSGIAMFTTLVGVLLCYVTFAIIELQVTLNDSRTQVTSVARMIAVGAGAALAFRDEDGARDALAAIRDNPEIVTASVMLPSGDALARYDREASDIATIANPWPLDGVLARLRVSATEPVEVSGEPVGTVVINADLSAVWRWLVTKLALSAIEVGLVLLLVALPLSRRLQRLISEPVIDLSIARQLAELMGSGVSVESIPGTGSTFRFTILAEIDGDMAPPVTAHRALRRVLAVDDNRTNRQILEHQCTSAGLTVQSAEDGPSSLSLLRSTDVPPDLVILDDHMPGMRGLDVARAIRADANPELAGERIVALTANAVEGDREQCIAAGMDDYLPKPFKRDQLKAMIARHLTVRRHAGDMASTGPRLAAPAAAELPTNTLDASHHRGHHAEL